MITVKVRAYATLRRYIPGVAVGESTPVDLPDGATVETLLNRLGIPLSELRVCFAGDLYREADYALKDGESVALFPPIGGGGSRAMLSA